MPPSLRDWLPEDRLAWFILAAIEELMAAATFAFARLLDGLGPREVMRLTRPRPLRSDRGPPSDSDMAGRSRRVIARRARRYAGDAQTRDDARGPTRRSGSARLKVAT